MLLLKGKDGWYYVKEDGTLDENQSSVEPDGLITAKEVRR